MSRGLGKVQLSILEEMNHSNFEGSNYSYTIKMLMDRISASQPSISRAISGLVKLGRVKKSIYLAEGESMQKWCYVYVLTEHEGKQVSFTQVEEKLPGKKKSPLYED